MNSPKSKQLHRSAVINYVINANKPCNLRLSKPGQPKVRFAGRSKICCAHDWSRDKLILSPNAIEQKFGRKSHQIAVNFFFWSSPDFPLKMISNLAENRLLPPKSTPKFGAALIVQPTQAQKSWGTPSLSAPTLSAHCAFRLQATTSTCRLQ